jgi:uncharacterized membrane protein
MTDSLLFTLLVVTALGCGLIAGIFFAFSAFVMKALARIPPAQGIAAMQSINVVVLNPFFLGVFFGTAVACVILMVAAVTRWPTAGAAYMLAGGALYLAGTILVTGACNVPLNNALAAVDPASSAGAATWAAYLKRWMAWNHVRTAAALAAAALLMLAIR